MDGWARIPVCVPPGRKPPLHRRQAWRPVMACDGSLASCEAPTYDCVRQPPRQPEGQALGSTRRSPVLLSRALRSHSWPRVRAAALTRAIERAQARRT